MGRPLSDIDPRKLNVNGPRARRRSRKDRKKPAPPEQLKAGEAEALEFAYSLPLSPGLVSEARGDGYSMSAPHNDRDLWELQLCQAFGTRSTSLIQTFTHELARLCSKDWDPDRQLWKTSEVEWNALLALVADHKPENSTQAALAAQMAATHLMVMRLSEQALNRGHIVNETSAGIASRLARTFTAQCEAMLALKGKSRTARQSIHVTREDHIHYHDHRGGGENDGQPQEPRAQTIEGRTTLPGDSQVNGRAMPGTSGERETDMPQARRGQGKRSPKG